MRNVKIKVNINFSETDESVTEAGCVEALDDGTFQLILDEGSEFDIDRLEKSLLQTNYPALRSALCQHLERVGKKKPGSKRR